MTQDIIEMARQAGFRHPNPHDGYMGLAFDRRDGTDTGPSLEAFAKLVAAKEREALRERFQIVTAAETRAAILNEREACESIEYDLAKSPAMFATMAEYKSYRDGVEKYRAAIRARGEA
jgi:hypothetical protein